MKRFAIGAIGLMALFFLAAFPFFVPQIEAAIYDNFKSGPSSAKWAKQFQPGQSGPSVKVTGGRLQVDFPAASHSSYNDPEGGSFPYDIFSAGVQSTLTLQGDFDLAAEYYLPTWPGPSPAQPDSYGNGVRLALGIQQVPSGLFCNMTRMGGEGPPGEVYTVDFNHRFPDAPTPTADTSGSLRITRQGAQVRSYFSSQLLSQYHNDPKQMAWTELIPVDPEATLIPGPVKFVLWVWSHDLIFSRQHIVVQFDNMVVNSGEIDISVQKMQYPSSPGIKIYDENNKPINYKGSDFPMELRLASPAKPASEKVFFKLEEAPLDNVDYEVKGYDDQNEQVIFGPKTITFKKGKQEQAFTFGSKDIHPPAAVGKTESINWQFKQEGYDDVVKQQVPKKIYFGLKSPISTGNLKSGTRIEVLDIAVELTEGLQDPDLIRLRLEHELYEKYKFPVKHYGAPGVNIPTHFDPLLKIFYLKRFLEADWADCAGMSTMHMLTCRALGVPAVIIRMVEDELLTNDLAVRRGSEVLGTLWKTGELSYNGGWHQVTRIDNNALMKIYDPLTRYQVKDYDPPEAYKFSAGTLRDDFAAFVVQKVKWRNQGLSKIE
jgi:hypothetical protein